MNNKILMPRELTAENGAKALLAGEFLVEIPYSCDVCHNLGCPDCDEGYPPQKIPVPWSTIKEIYAKAVDGLGESVDNLIDREECIKAIVSTSKQLQKG